MAATKLGHGGKRKDAGRKPRAEVRMRQQVKLSLTEAEDAALRAAVPKGQTLTDFCRQVLFARAALELRAQAERLGPRPDPLPADERGKEAFVTAALDKGLKGGRAKPGVFARVRRRHGLPPVKPRTP